MRPRRGGISAAILCLMLTASGSILSACGGTPEPPPSPEAVQEAEISASLEMARFAFLSGRYDQAIRAYSGSLDRAYARDDVAAIAVAGQELAFSYLRAGKPKEAVQAASRTRDELARRGRPARPALALVEATARYRLKETAVAERLAREVAAAPDDPMAASRATFLLGMIAADRRDVPALTAASDTLSRSGEQPEMKADNLHLSGRLHLIRKDYVQAADAFMAEEALRRASGDEPGVARALALAADSTERNGQKAKAADLWFRSGRSAAQEGDAEAASRLRRAESLARHTGQPALANEARRLRLDLSKDRP
ncbi:hypothetical protein SAE02_44940 [Skermanella aerolata]|uniref:Tetratricopeptide repeat protein n=1 Tax=Skermanella aerolata TaxID=393310 RepID=A0A512DV72_9PROT|nr:hypothetical protein [Skermanella aerolata]KJB94961.1 hypothetical protein N826_07835 [Skermanella aerolata KACC 11604]GEO40346.1 hypothetical protein SAE02_44940 [Skermanella aerolata]